MSEVKIAINNETIRLPNRGTEILPGAEFKRDGKVLPVDDFDRLMRNGVLVERDARPVANEEGGDPTPSTEVSKLLEMNANDLIKELPSVPDETLMELEGAESNGKNRSTVRDAISEEFDRRSE